MRVSVTLFFALSMAFGCGDGKSATNSPLVYSLTLSPGPNGTLTASPVAPTYAPGTLVTLTATPNELWTVQGWSGTDNDATSQPINHVTMDRDRTVGVQFVAQATCPADPA